MCSAPQLPTPPASLHLLARRGTLPAHQSHPQAASDSPGAWASFPDCRKGFKMGCVRGIKTQGDRQMSESRRSAPTSCGLRPPQAWATRWAWGRWPGKLSPAEQGILISVFPVPDQLHSGRRPDCFWAGRVGRMGKDVQTVSHGKHLAGCRDNMC